MLKFYKKRFKDSLKITAFYFEFESFYLIIVCEDLSKENLCSP